MKTPLCNQNSFGKVKALAIHFRIVNSLKYSLIIFILLLLAPVNRVYSQSTSPAAEQANTQNTEGTFQFESPTGKVLFWKMDFIESLYPGIESRRALNHDTIWHFNADMDIIIFAKNIITSSDFVPLESPYNGFKEYKY